MERPNLTEDDAQAAQERILDHSGSILGRFEAIQSAPRIGRGESRSTFAEIHFFRLGERLFLDFASPEASHECSWAPSRRSLGTLGRSWDVPGGPQERPGDFLGSLLGVFGALLGDLQAPEGP